MGGRRRGILPVERTSFGLAKPLGVLPSAAERETCNAYPVVGVRAYEFELIRNRANREAATERLNEGLALGDVGLLPNRQVRHDRAVCAVVQINGREGAADGTGQVQERGASCGARYTQHESNESTRVSANSKRIRAGPNPLSDSVTSAVSTRSGMNGVATVM